METTDPELSASEVEMTTTEMDTTDRKVTATEVEMTTTDLELHGGHHWQHDGYHVQRAHFDISESIPGLGLSDGVVEGPLTGAS